MALSANPGSLFYTRNDSVTSPSFAGEPALPKLETTFAFNSQPQPQPQEHAYAILPSASDALMLNPTPIPSIGSVLNDAVRDPIYNVDSHSAATATAAGVQQQPTPILPFAQPTQPQRITAIKDETFIASHLGGKQVARPLSQTRNPPIVSSSLTLPQPHPQVLHPDTFADNLRLQRQSSLPTSTPPSASTTAFLPVSLAPVNDSRQSLSATTTMLPSVPSRPSSVNIMSHGVGIGGGASGMVPFNRAQPSRAENSLLNPTRPAPFENASFLPQLPIEPSVVPALDNLPSAASQPPQQSTSNLPEPLILTPSILQGTVTPSLGLRHIAPSLESTSISTPSLGVGPPVPSAPSLNLAPTPTALDVAPAVAPLLNQPSASQLAPGIALSQVPPPLAPGPTVPPIALTTPAQDSVQQQNRILNFVNPAPDTLAPYGELRPNAPSLALGNIGGLTPGLPQTPVMRLPHPSGFTVQPQQLIHPTAVQGSVPMGAPIDFQAPVSNVLNPGTSVTPEQLFERHMSMGYAYRNMARQDLASESFRAAACIRPDSSEARSCFALACHEQGMFETAVSEFNVAIRLGASFPDDVYNNLGNTYRSLGMSHEAEIAYRTALNISPRHAHAWNNLGNAMRGQGKLDEAMHCYTSSLAASPGFAPAHCNLAGLFRDQGKPRDAETQYRAALASDPHLAEAAAGLGTALRDMGRAEEAIGYYVRAVGLQPNGADHHANLANTYKDLNRIEESITSYQSALELQPDMPDAFCNMVHSLSVICDWRNRKENFKVLLSIIHKQLDALLKHPSTNPRLVVTLVGALNNSTPKQVIVNGGSRSEREESVLSRGEESRGKKLRHPSSPMSSRSGASSRNGDSSAPASRLSGYAAHARKVRFSAALSSIVNPVIATGLPSVQPFHALIYPMTPEKFKALSAAYASRAELMVQGIAKVQQMWATPMRNGGRLKVGYVSSDYNNHPYSHLTQSVYGLHRHSNVECFCYALTPSDGSSWRRRIETESENFRDISSFTAQQSAQAIANDGIHVLVNCNGYTKGARTELFALRPAPVQVSFMGFPGTLGAHYIEYFITDKETSPPHLASRMHSESLLYHPHTYFVNDHKQTSIEGPRNYPGGPLTRTRYGLPENCFLFIMHNQLYKIDPATFDVWARILKRVPNSKLWLLRFPPSGESRIREEARLRGLGPDRILFTDVASKEEHVARCGLGDLFLDTPTCNAHTTGTDALWSGIPLITCPGSLFASRVAASLLRAAGIPELICSDMAEYEELAVHLATNPHELMAIRHKLETSRRHNPLFDTRRWVRNVEALYWQAWRRFEAGLQPAHIEGRDVYEEYNRNWAHDPTAGSASATVSATNASRVPFGITHRNGVASLIAS